MAISSEIDDFIRQRRWAEIKSAWDSYLGNRAPLLPESVPTTTINSLLLDRAIFVDVPPKREISDTEQPRSEIGEVILHEAIYWLLKAVHVLAASEVHIDQGMPSWSVSAAYQSCMFSARAILGFLGIGVGEIEHMTVIADLCRDARGISPRNMADLGAFNENAKFRSLGVLIDHRQLWYVFQRSLRVTSCNSWSEDTAIFLKNLEIPELTKQRHGLHYSLEYWIVREDLCRPYCPKEFTDFAPTGEGKKRYETDRNNFSVAVARDIATMALTLFFEISSPYLEGSRDLVNASVTSQRHPIFFDELTAGR